MRRLKVKLFNIIVKILGFLFHYLPIDDKKIVIVNFNGKGYGDNGKYIAEEILTNSVDHKIIWLVNSMKDENNIFPHRIIKVKNKSLFALFHLSTSKYWIDNTRKSFYPIKKKKQIYIQTWHASLGIKKIEKDAIKFLDDYYIDLAKKDAEMCDLMVASSVFREELYKSAFWYNGEILRTGTPKCDIFFKKDKHANIIKKVYSRYRLSTSKKIILFAPTFRKNMDYDLQEIISNLPYIINTLSKKFRGDWIFALRLHPNMNITINSESEYLINATDYEDMQELLIASEILITDYSSSMFDMGIQMKKCILFTPDLDNYISDDRGVYFNLKELPFPIAQNIEELKESINKYENEEYLIKINSFFESLGMKENGFGSRDIANYILSSSN